MALANLTNHGPWFTVSQVKVIEVKGPRLQGTVQLHIGPCWLYLLLSSCFLAFPFARLEVRGEEVPQDDSANVAAVLTLPSGCQKSFYTSSLLKWVWFQVRWHLEWMSHHRRTKDRKPLGSSVYLIVSHLHLIIWICYVRKESACLKAILHGSKATLSIKHSTFFQTRRTLPPPLSVPFHWYLYLSTELATFSFTQVFPYLPEINSLRPKSTPLALSPQPSVYCGMNNKALSRFRNYFKYTLELKFSSQ